LETTGAGEDHEIVVPGGGSRLEFWIKMIGELFGCPLRCAGTDGLDGAAVPAGKANS
jgi:sugar (pentulose or hexulose) kinase